METALAAYQTGNFALAYQELSRIVADAYPVQPQHLLMLAQSAAKMGKLSQAGNLYLRAATLLPEKSAALRKIAAEMKRQIIEADTPKALSRMETCRKMLRSGQETPAMLREYFHDLRRYMAIDEQRIMTQLLLDRLRAGDEALLALEPPEHFLAWCEDDVLLDRRVRLLAGGGGQDVVAPQAAGTGQPLKIGWLGHREEQYDGSRLLLQSLAASPFTEAAEICFIDTGDGEPPEGVHSLLIAGLDDDQARAALAAKGFDAIIDTGGPAAWRPQLLTRRISPLHLALAGYPGPREGQICDGFISDTHLAGPAGKDLCGLPQLPPFSCFTAAPPVPASAATSRESLGLPADAVVIAALHPPAHIGPKTADLWAEILTAAPNTVLWLGLPDALTKANAKRWFGSLDLPEDRLIVSPAPADTEIPDWLSQADLALDTVPFNGLGQTKAALWAHRPVVTMRGRLAGGRTSASLLAAAGLDDLVATGPEDYVQKAVALAQHPGLRQQWTGRIAESLSASRIFDISAFAADLTALLTKGRAVKT
ncbi:hypothetical protein ACQ3G6_03945 [Allorhizobium undicola]|uniref:O-linked N-acetylglucosamine transferase family protein n=1 Tax=Allorhizobium undicola TaxID=78527 RepID=UPI003D342164